MHADACFEIYNNSYLIHGRNLSDKINSYSLVLEKKFNVTHWCGD